MTTRQKRTVLITALVLGVFCLGMVFWALTRSPDPVAEPVPNPTTSAPPTSSTTVTTTTTTTTTAEPTTTTSRPPVKAPAAPPKTTARPPATTAAPATTASGLCQGDQWRRDTQYQGGALVLHNGAEWFARSWNYNSEPGVSADNVWVRAFNC